MKMISFGEYKMKITIKIAEMLYDAVGLIAILIIAGSVFFL